MSFDKTIPLYDLDHAPSHLDIIISACFIVNGRLDIDILHDSLQTLVKQWPILTARLFHDKANRQYGLILPRSFENGRKPFLFTTAHTETSYPCMPSRKARLNPDMQNHIAHFRGPATPHSTSDLLKQPDAPMFQVHIHAFSDVTCIGVHIPHTVTDVPGLSHILQAWCSLMANPDAKLPRVLEGDMVGQFGDPEEMYPKTSEGREVFHREMTSSAAVWGYWEGWWWLILAVFYIIAAREEVRLIFIPQSVVDGIRKGAMDEHGEWVSENDAVSALLAKMHLYNRASTSQPFTLSFIANLRKQIPSLSQPPSEAVYLHNGLYMIGGEPTALRDLKASSVPSLALRYRHTIIAQRPLPQAAMSIALHRHLTRMHASASMGPPEGMLFHVTSWAVAKWGELDFRGALAQDDLALGSEDQEMGRVRFVGGVCIPPGRVRAGRSLWSIIKGRVREGKDGEAGYWCEMGAKKSAWPEIAKFVDSWSV